MISKDDKLVSICYLDADNDLHFTDEFIHLTRDLPNRRAFACQLISWWDVDHVSSLLDYFGPPDKDDIYDCIDENSMGIDPDICELMEYKEVALPNLNADWYHDLLVAKLVSIKLPERLIKEYVEAKKSKGVQNG